MGVKIGFIGLGVMGYPMAGWLSKAGHSVTVYNRTGVVGQRWLTEFSGNIANTPGGAAKNADIVFICVGNDKDVLAVTMGSEGVVSTIKSGSILIDHTTTSADLAKNLANEARLHECGFIDAPVSGGQQGAEGGQLTVMCGGSVEDFAKIESVVACFSKAVRRRSFSSFSLFSSSRRISSSRRSRSATRNWTRALNAFFFAAI